MITAVGWQSTTASDYHNIPFPTARGLVYFTPVLSTLYPFSNTTKSTFTKETRERHSYTHLQPKIIATFALQ